MAWCEVWETKHGIGSMVGFSTQKETGTENGKQETGKQESGWMVCRKLICLFVFICLFSPYKYPYTCPPIHTPHAPCPMSILAS